MEEEVLENVLEPEESDDGSDHPPPLLSPCGRGPGRSGRSSRLQVQRSSVCSRAYFVVVMVFFHVYILNVIALLLYVHYSSGAAELAAVAAVDRGSAADHGPGGDEDPGLPPTFTLPRIEGIRVGHVQQVALVPGKKHQMVTRSLKPLLFEIRGFLTEEECRVVVQLAQLKGLTETLTSALGPEQEQEQWEQHLLSLSSEEMFSLLDLDQDGLLQQQEIVTHSRSRDGTWLSPENLRHILSGLQGAPGAVLTLLDFRLLYDPSSQQQGQRAGVRGQFKQRSRQTWLHQGQGSHHVLQTLRTRVGVLTRLPSSLVELSEPLHVVRFEAGDFSHAHHDSGHAHLESSCVHTRLLRNGSSLTEVSCRYLTVQFLLSSAGEGGETTFPVADNRTYDEEALLQGGVDLLDTQRSCSRGNLRLEPVVGTALLWYNHLSDGRGWMGDLDEYALHGDCPVRRGLKWTASSWVNVDPDPRRQDQYQRMVTTGGRRALLDDRHQPPPHSRLHQDL